MTTMAMMQDAELGARVDAVLATALEERRIVGAVVHVARDGEIVHRRAAGFADRETRTPMRLDTPFRYASLTKPIVAATTLGLVGNGALSLDDEVARWLPEFRPTFGELPARITLRHLLTHSSGLSYGFLEPPGGPYHAANVSDGLDQPGLSLDENLRRLGRLPLAFEPGRAFLYSLAYDVLGAVLERATGAPLPEVVRRVVTEPLGLRDLGFVAPAGLALAAPYASGSPAPTRIEDGTCVPFLEGGVTFAPSRAFDARSYPSGGAGMFGTASDFLRFLEAVRTRAPFVPERWLDAMARDQLAGITSPMLGDAWGYGFGGSVLRDPSKAETRMAAGTMRWGGAYGHSWWIDPAARISVLLMTNTAFEGMIGPLRTQVERAVYGASGGHLA